MAITWIEIVDTAVKIGLGAGVTGFATLLVNRQNHAKNIERENHLRNIAVLENVTQHIEEMTHALLKHWSFVLEKARNKEKGVSTSDEKSEKINELRSDVYHLFKGLTDSEGRLLLIGCVDQQRKLREYGGIISEYHRYSSKKMSKCKVLN